MFLNLLIFFINFYSYVLIKIDKKIYNVLYINLIKFMMLDDYELF